MMKENIKDFLESLLLSAIFAIIMGGFLYYLTSYKG